MGNASRRLDRFTVCLEKGLLARLDAVASERGYPSRSRAMADFIRRAIVKKEWKQGGECAGTISVVYGASGSAAGRRIEALLSEKRGCFLSAQTHILRGGRIMVTAAVSGRPAVLQRLADGLRAVKGVTHGSFSIISPL